MSQLFAETIWPGFAFMHQIGRHAIPIEMFRMLKYSADMVYFRRGVGELMNFKIARVIYELLMTNCPADIY